MSEIKINHIKSVHSMRLTPSGLGAVEIINKTDNDDGALELFNTGTQKSVIIKAPSNDASYQLTFPTQNPVLNQFLRVASTLYGNSQLDYSDVPFPTFDSTNASTYLEGTIPVGRLSEFNGSVGGGLKLATSFTINDGVSIDNVEFVLNQNKFYKIVAKNINFDGLDYPVAYFLDDSGTAQTVALNRFQGSADSNINSSSSNEITFNTGISTTSYGFTAELSTYTGISWMTYIGFSRDTFSKAEGYVTFRQNDSTARINTLRFETKNNSNYIGGTIINLYEYNQT